MSKNPQADSLAALIAARDEAREAAKELHGLIKDAHQAKRDVLDFLNKGTTILVLAAIEAELEKYMGEVQERTEFLINEVTGRLSGRIDAVIRRVDEREETLEKLAVRTSDMSQLWRESRQ